MERQAPVLTTLTVVQSWGAIRPGGAQALVLETKEQGTIAFAVSPDVVAGIRKALDALEPYSGG
jgi:hypothetical protein